MSSIHVHRPFQYQDLLDQCLRLICIHVFTNNQLVNLAQIARVADFTLLQPWHPWQPFITSQHYSTLSISVSISFATIPTNQTTTESELVSCSFLLLFQLQHLLLQFLLQFLLVMMMQYLSIYLLVLLPFQSVSNSVASQLYSHVQISTKPKRVLVFNVFPSFFLSCLHVITDSFLGIDCVDARW